MGCIKSEPRLVAQKIGSRPNRSLKHQGGADASEARLQENSAKLLNGRKCRPLENAFEVGCTITPSSST